MKRCLYIFVFFCFYSHSELVEKTQAVINEQMISLLDLKNFEQQLKLGLAPPDLLMDTLYEKSKLLKDKSLLLDYMVKCNLLSQIAEDKKIPTSQSESVNRALEGIQGNLSKKSFYKKLDTAHQNIENLKKSIVVNLRNERLLSQFVISQIRVFEEEIEAYYFSKHNKNLFKKF